MNGDPSTSVLAQLLNRARSSSENYNLLLSLFAIDRPLERSSVIAAPRSILLRRLSAGSTRLIPVDRIAAPNANAGRKRSFERRKYA